MFPTLRAVAVAAAFALAALHPTGAAAIQIAEQTAWVRYSAGSGQTSFAYPWPIYSNTHLSVWKGDALLTLTTHYTVTGVGNQSGGNVVFTSGNQPTAGQEIVIMRDTTRERTSQYEAGRAFTPGNLNIDFNQLVLQVQDLDTRLRMAPAENPDDWPGLQMTLPEPDQDKCLTRDESTRQVINRSCGEGGVGGDCEPPSGRRTVGTCSEYLDNNAVFALEDYGAACDGVTADDAAWTRVLLDAADAGGGLIVIPNKTCAHAAAIVIGSRTRVVGRGTRSRLKYIGAATTHQLKMQAIGADIFDSGLEGFTLDANCLADYNILIDSSHMGRYWGLTLHNARYAAFEVTSNQQADSEFIDIENVENRPDPFQGGCASRFAKIHAGTVGTVTDSQILDSNIDRLASPSPWNAGSVWDTRYIIELDDVNRWTIDNFRLSTGGTSYRAVIYAHGSETNPYKPFFTGSHEIRRVYMEQQSTPAGQEAVVVLLNADGSASCTNSQTTLCTQNADCSGGATCQTRQNRNNVITTGLLEPFNRTYVEIKRTGTMLMEGTRIFWPMRWTGRAVLADPVHIKIGSATEHPTNTEVQISAGRDTINVAKDATNLATTIIDWGCSTSINGHLRGDDANQGCGGTTSDYNLIAGVKPDFNAESANMGETIDLAIDKRSYTKTIHGDVIPISAEHALESFAVWVDDTANTSVSLGQIPAGAYVKNIYVDVAQGFSGTEFIQIGHDADNDAYVQPMTAAGILAAPGEYAVNTDRCGDNYAQLTAGSQLGYNGASCRQGTNDGTQCLTNGDCTGAGTCGFGTNIRAYRANMGNNASGGALVVVEWYRVPTAAISALTGTTGDGMCNGDSDITLDCSNLPQTSDPGAASFYCLDDIVYLSINGGPGIPLVGGTVQSFPGAPVGCLPAWASTAGDVTQLSGLCLGADGHMTFNGVVEAQEFVAASQASTNDNNLIMERNPGTPTCAEKVAPNEVGLVPQSNGTIRVCNGATLLGTIP